MADSEADSWISTEPSTQVLKERGERAKEDESANSQTPKAPNSLPPLFATPKELEVEGTFARLVPMNKFARESFHRLAIATEEEYKHHKQFVSIDKPDSEEETPTQEGCFVLTLGLLPEFPALGWRIGKGRNNIRNHGVDLLIIDGEEVAGVHARFCWVKGGGGFFIVADNIRGAHVTLNGESLRQSQRLIPFRNQISIGECYFSVQFKERSRRQEEEFQMVLARFHSRVLQDKTPLLLPTPSENEVTIGDWIVRNPIASGSFGRVSVVTHRYTGQPAAAKELWRTTRNYLSVDREVMIAKRLKNLKHKRLGIPFEIYHQKVYEKIERARIATLLDQTWTPGQTDAIDLYILYSPLSTSNFLALYRSNASLPTRSHLFTQILSGISFLHSHGIIHRDIKPANLTVRSYDPPDAQIIDFGCAVMEGRVLYDRPGTIPYLAPEQKEGMWAGKEVDIWAVGLVGVELLGCKRGNEKVGKEGLRAIKEWIEEQRSHPVLMACETFLKWEAEERMGVDEVIERYLGEYSGDGRRGNKRGVGESEVDEGVGGLVKSLRRGSPG